MKTLFLALLIVCISVHADQDIIVPFQSYHFDRSAEMNEQNYGVGFRQNEYKAFYYHNSIRKPGVFIGKEFRFKDSGLKLNAGILQGYTNNFAIPMIAPSYEFDIPTGSIEVYLGASEAVLFTYNYRLNDSSEHDFPERTLPDYLHITYGAGTNAGTLGFNLERGNFTHRVSLSYGTIEYKDYWGGQSRKELQQEERFNFENIKITSCYKIISKLCAYAGIRYGNDHYDTTYSPNEWHYQNGSTHLPLGRFKDYDFGTLPIDDFKNIYGRADWDKLSPTIGFRWNGDKWYADLGAWSLKGIKTRASFDITPFNDDAELHKIINDWAEYEADLYGRKWDHSIVIEIGFIL